MNDMNEAIIEIAVQQAHELFVKNNWTWGGAGCGPAYIPPPAQIEKHIRDMIKDVESSGGSLHSGRIGVSKNDDLVDIEIRFCIGHTYGKRRRKKRND